MSLPLSLATTEKWDSVLGKEIACDIAGIFTQCLRPSLYFEGKNAFGEVTQMPLVSRYHALLIVARFASHGEVIARIHGHKLVV